MPQAWRTALIYQLFQIFQLNIFKARSYLHVKPFEFGHQLLYTMVIFVLSDVVTDILILNDLISRTSKIPMYYKSGGTVPEHTAEHFNVRLLSPNTLLGIYLLYY